MKLNATKLTTPVTVALVIGGLMFSQPAYATSVNVGTGELNFGADSGSFQTVKIGEESILGFTHRYNNVFSGVDAIATVIDVVNLDFDDDENNGADNKIDDFDEEDLSDGTGKQIETRIDIFGSSGASQTGYLTYRIDFVASGTSNAVTLENINIRVADIDGKQFAKFAGITAHELSSSPATNLQVSDTNGAYEFLEPGDLDSDSPDEDHWAVVEYAQASSVTITLGARKAGSAYFGVAFTDTTWSNTPTRLVPTLTEYDLTYDGNGATGGSAPSLQTSTQISSTVVLAAPQGNLLKTGCTFAGWNTRVDGQGANYLDTQSITMTADTTLYAKWTCAAPNSGGAAAPAATTAPTLAATGASIDWLFVAGLFAVIAGSSFLAFSRRKRTT